MAKKATGSKPIRKDRSRVGEWEILFVEVPPELKERLRVSAREHRRSMSCELIVLLENHPALPKLTATGKQVARTTG